MSTIAEQNAGFDVAYNDILKLIHERGGWFKDQMLAHFETREGRDALLDVVQRVLAAAEGVRAKA